MDVDYDRINIKYSCKLVTFCVRVILNYKTVALPLSYVGKNLFHNYLQHNLHLRKT